MILHNLYKHTAQCLAIGAATWTLVACSPQAVVPENATTINEKVSIYPDYRDITIPANIAPLNIQVKSAGSEYVGCVECGSNRVVAAAGKDGILQFDSLEWKKLLTDARGKALNVTLYAERDGQWVRFPSYNIEVAKEDIDRYLSYRLIEPSYELYRQMGLYQRDLENFNVKTIYENNRTFENENNHCVNCHNYQNYSTKHMLFHVRGEHGGTVFIENGKVEKRIMKSDSILAGATYPTWHPTRNWVVFSSNQTGQTFHIRNKQKVEVVDYGSDLVFYDVDKREFRNILKTDSDLETFPCWSPDGSKIFYTSAHVPIFANVPDTVRRDNVSKIYKDLHYNVMSISFDAATGKFGTPQMEVDCAALGKSAAVARVSPDGRYLLFTLADYGQFHIWHKSADLYVKDLQTQQVYPLKATNSPDVDSYHTWSSNGRWIVFSSRRDDGSFTRPYIAYFDKNGQGHKAFLLPQADPLQNIRLTKSYNVPELSKDAVPTTAEEVKAAIYK
uniref:TolB family protein n=1 Tax=Alloprevotella sp. TaxID=1872471 RepID=UPI003FEE697C